MRSKRMANKWSTFATTAMIGMFTLAGSAYSQTTPAAPAGGMGGMNMGGMNMGGGQPSAGDSAPSTAEFKAASAKSMAGMMFPYTGNIDRDYATAMIAHHQGAGDMAAVALRYGKDPGIRQTAQDIIKYQNAEISKLRDFLARP